MDEVTKLHKLELKTDVREAVDAFRQELDGFECVMMLAIHKDGSQRLVTSTSSGMQKMFLVQFLNAWATKWFDLADQ